MAFPPSSAPSPFHWFSNTPPTDSTVSPCQFAGQKSVNSVNKVAPVVNDDAEADVWSEEMLQGAVVKPDVTKITLDEFDESELEESELEEMEEMEEMDAIRAARRAKVIKSRPGVQGIAGY